MHGAEKHVEYINFYLRKEWVCGSEFAYNYKNTGTKVPVLF